MCSQQANGKQLLDPVLRSYWKVQFWSTNSDDLIYPDQKIVIAQKL